MPLYLVARHIMLLFQSCLIEKVFIKDLTTRGRDIEIFPCY